MTGPTPSCRSAATGNRSRGQSHVVGAVLLLGLTVIALAGITAAVGTIVEDQTARADTERVVNDVNDAIRPVETTGHRSETIRFSAGQLDTRSREIRVFNSSGLISEIQADALVYEQGDHRVASVAGATVNGVQGNAWLEREPPIAVGPDVVIVGAVVLNGTGGVGGSGGVSTTVHTNVSHHRTDLGNGTYTVAIETATPRPFERHASDIGADTDVSDLDGDGIPSVEMTFPGTKEGYLVVHDLGLEVGDG